MAAPTFVNKYSSAWNTNTSPKTTPTLTGSVGDVLVAVVGDEQDDNLENYTITNSGTGQTWTKKTETAGTTTADAWAQASTAVLANALSSNTVSATRTGAVNGWFGLTVAHFTASNGIGASATTPSTGSATPSLNITTTQANSALVAIFVDYQAVDGTSRTWRTINSVTPTAGNGYELFYFRGASNYTVYVAYWPDAGASGSTVAVGLTAPASMDCVGTVVEVLGTAGGTPGDVAGVLATATALAKVPVIAGGAGVAGVASTSTAQGRVPVVSAGATVTGVAATATALAPVPSIAVGVTVTAPTAIASASVRAPLVIGDVGAGSMFGTSAPPGTPSAWNDDPSAVVVANEFYIRSDSSIDYSVTKARIYVDASIISSLPSSAELRFYITDLYSTPSGSLVETVSSIVSGWNEITWDTPIPVTKGVPFLIGYQFSDTFRYLTYPSPGSGAIASVNNADLFMSSVTDGRSQYRYGSNNPEAGAGQLYGVDITVEETHIAGSVSAVAATATATAIVPVVSVPGQVAGVLATATAMAQVPVVTGETIISSGGPATATAMAHPAVVTGVTAGAVTAVAATATAQARVPVVTTAATVAAVLATATALAQVPTISGGAIVQAVRALSTAMARVPSVTDGSSGGGSINVWYSNGTAWTQI